MMARDLHGRGESRRRRIELAQLQFYAFSKRTRPDPGGIQTLDAGKDVLDVRRAAIDLGLERLGDFFERFGEVAVVADGVDDGARDGELLRRQARKLKLPQQVFLQGFAGRVGELLLAVVIIAGPRRIRRSDTALAPALVQD